MDLKQKISIYESKGPKRKIISELRKQGFLVDRPFYNASNSGYQILNNKSEPIGRLVFTSKVSLEVIGRSPSSRALEVFAKNYSF